MLQSFNLNERTENPKIINKRTLDNNVANDWLCHWLVSYVTSPVVTPVLM